MESGVISSNFSHFCLKKNPNVTEFSFLNPSLWNLYLNTIYGYRP